MPNWSFAFRRSPLIGLVVLAACKTVTVAPYAGGSAPRATNLLAHTEPPLDAVQVPRARIRANRGVRGDLAFLAQAPDRFRASVTVAGNEMVSVSLYEGGYDLIYKLDDLPQGYYHGASSACAVQVLLGVPLDGPQLVTVVLGGVPVIEAAKVVDQRWDERTARERLQLTNGVYDQELRFASIDDQWRFAGATLWRREGAQRSAVWSLDHESWHNVDGVLLPETTQLRRPSGRSEDVVRIDYRIQDPNPAFARKNRPTPAPDAADDHPPDPKQPDDEPSRPASNSGGDPWNDGGAWEGDDAPWEGQDAPEPPSGPTPSEPRAAQDRAPSSSTAPSTETPPPEVPPLFRLEQGALPARGDVCRRVRS